MKKLLSLLTLLLLFVVKGYSFTQNVTVANFSFSPSSFTINLGDTVKFTWVSGTHTTTSDTIPSGATAWDQAMNMSATTFIYVPSKAGTYKYHCTFHASFGMVGNFTVNCPNASASISAGGPTTFCQGQSVLLTSKTSSNITSYQWQKNGTAISGATSSTYTAKSNGTYTLKVKNNCGKTATSNGIAVTVNPLPGATITPADTVFICSGDSIKLKANTGTSLSYVWKRNNVVIAGATSSTYSAKKAGVYKVVVTKTTTGCSKTSAPTTVIVNCSSAMAKTMGNDQIKIFPNPSSGDFHLQLIANPSARSTINVLDESGKLISSKTVNSGNISFGNDLKAGVYFVEIKNEKAVVIYRDKIIKQ